MGSGPDSSVRALTQQKMITVVLPLILTAVAPILGSQLARPRQTKKPTISLLKQNLWRI